MKAFDDMFKKMYPPEKTMQTIDKKNNLVKMIQAFTKNIRVDDKKEEPMSPTLPFFVQIEKDRKKQVAERRTSRFFSPAIANAISKVKDAEIEPVTEEDRPKTEINPFN